MRKSCVIYDSWADQMLNLPDDMAGKYIKALLEYAIYGDDIESDNTFINAMLVPVKKKLDEDAKTWEEAKRQRSEGGKKGMANRWHNSVITQDNSVITQDNSVTEDITPITVSVSVSDTVTDIKKKNNKKKKNTFHNFPEREYDYSELKAGADHV